MSIIRFLETFLFRDILSYLIPGFINIYAISILYSNFNVIVICEKYFDKIHIAFSLSVIFIISYIFGYVGSTFMFILRSKVPILNRPIIEPPVEGIVNIIKEVFGDWIANENQQNLIAYCLEYVQLNTPEIYFEKIERRVTLRNFEVALSFSSLLFVGAMLSSFESWNKFYSLIPLATLILFLAGSRYTDGEIDNFSFRLFVNSVLYTKRHTT
ncbi:hypothetical protein GF407_15970 [candidate division KSB1 bacterium]|nr:hypothetical protein [candidate division KSB1 bacterium]